MERPPATELAALLFIRLNRALPIETFDLMIEKGLAVQTPIADERATSWAHGRGYALTDAGRRLLDGLAWPST
ncbi:hypothetical protein EC845_0537 [Comamonas sp. BIGb0124]|uniref:hypothetical protein n=1 Tax=Comamonas sp. BIGb0124 TaxID=2485130 RepID=UPI000F48F230|nr:hypothetical protein [Comamonas sp. BIGb0124]ROR24512.1 hypothetical protein EC845_0537 [Comamonas sp. BIGb0124]